MGRQYEVNYIFVAEDERGVRGMIKEIRSSNMERDNRVTVIINSKSSEDAEKLYEAITTVLRKENHRRNNDISFDILCVGK